MISLGQPGQFDDTHLFAPCVIQEQGRFRMWYSGSQRTVAQRVFHLGMATSGDGRRFTKHAGGPVLSWEDGSRSVLTTAVARLTDSAVYREGGKLRMWFSATDFPSQDPLHTLHEVTSHDGVQWSEPSPPLLKNVYAPTILKEPGAFRMWYVDVSENPWKIRHATSPDGRTWRVSPAPVLEVNQPWERDRLFYPYVVKAGDTFLMWYGSYWSAERQKTAIGFAASDDGLTWHKSEHNPVFRPDPSRPWESHYTTSHSFLRLADGTWRAWYASRKKPPHVNKYFAIGTAQWRGVEPTAESIRDAPKGHSSK